MENQIAASKLAIKGYTELKKVNPDHELVKIMEFDKNTAGAFIKRFWDKKEAPVGFPGSMVAMRVEINYFLAVKKVLKEEYSIEI